MAKYDIFISYRREGGYDTAKHLYDLLSRDGYSVSFDIDTLRNGDFDKSLLGRIDECKDFILIVDQHAFDRTLDPSSDLNNDWLRCELAYALKKHKNIVPVFLSGITKFPANLPADIAGVVKKNGPEYNRYYFNDFYKTLKKRFLKSRSRRHRFLTFGICMLFICLSIYIFSPGSSDIPVSQNDTLYAEEDVKDKDSSNYYENIDTHKLFVKGLKNGVVYSPRDDIENNGITYAYKDGRVIDIFLHFGNACMIFTATDEGGFQQIINYDFGKIGYDAEEFEYPDNEYLIGQYDLNGDGVDELVIAVRTTNDKFLSENPDGSGIAINFFNLNYGKLELMAKLSTTTNIEPASMKLINNNAYVYWLRYDEKFTFNGKVFVPDDDFAERVFTDDDFK